MDTNTVAIFVDAENFREDSLNDLIEMINQNKEKIIIKKIYADFCNINKRFKETVIKNGFECIHNFSVGAGKNSSDMAMAIDIVKQMLLTNKEKRPSKVYLCSGDSDFSTLALFLREQEIEVVGVDIISRKANYFYVKSCNDFIFHSDKLLNNIILDNCENYIDIEEHVGFEEYIERECIEDEDIKNNKENNLHKIDFLKEIRQFFCQNRNYYILKKNNISEKEYEGIFNKIARELKEVKKKEKKERKN